MKFNAFYGALLILGLISVAFSKLTSPLPKNVTYAATSVMTELTTKTPAVENCPQVLIDWNDQGPSVLNLTDGTICWNITTKPNHLNMTMASYFYFSLTAHNEGNATGFGNITLYDAEDTLIWSYPNSFCTQLIDMVNTKLASSATSYVIVQSFFEIDTRITMNVQASWQLPSSTCTLKDVSSWCSVSSPNYPYPFPAEANFIYTINVGFPMSMGIYFDDFHVQGTNTFLTIDGPGWNRRFDDTGFGRLTCLSSYSTYELKIVNYAPQGTGNITYRAIIYHIDKCNNDYPIPTLAPYHLSETIDVGTVAMMVVPPVVFAIFSCFVFRYCPSLCRSQGDGQTRVRCTTSLPINTPMRDLPNLADASDEPRITRPTYNGTTSYGYSGQMRDLPDLADASYESGLTVSAYDETTSHDYENGQPEIYSQQPPMYWQTTFNQPRQSLPNYDDAIKLPTYTPPAASDS